MVYKQLGCGQNYVYITIIIKSIKASGGGYDSNKFNRIHFKVIHMLQCKLLGSQGPWVSKSLVPESH